MILASSIRCNNSILYKMFSGDDDLFTVCL